MGMTVRRVKDTRTKRVFIHKIADIRGGVAVNTSELGSDFLNEGAVLSAPENGICHVVKIAVLTAQATNSATSYNVQKGHNFKKDDFVMVNEGKKAYAINEIDTSAKTHDVIKVGTSLGVQIEAGEFLIEAAEEATSTESALKFIPLSEVGTGKKIEPGNNLDTDAWVIGVTHGNPLPECVAKHLKGIINY